MGRPIREKLTMGDICCEPIASSKKAEKISTSLGHGLWQVREIRVASASGILLLLSWILGFGEVPELVTTSLNLGALAISSWTFAPSTLRKLSKGKVGVGTLMTIAAIGALTLGQLEEAALLTFLYSISEGLEEYSLTSTRHGLRALLDLVPKEATVLQNHAEVKVSPDDLKPGDILVVRPGERFSADCRILNGRTNLDASALTGESVPVEAGPNDVVYAGTINGPGPVEAEVTSSAENNSLAKIVQIVEREQSRKGQSQRLADSIASKLVPGILIMGVLIVIYGFVIGEPTIWFERALVVLVASSPCALAISVPVTVVTAVGAATKIGVLIKGGGALEILGKVRNVALDKTGTLTRNRPVVIEVACAAKATKEQVLSLAAGLEARSEHPLAKAILEACPNPAAVTDVQSIPGSGIEGKFNNLVVRLGRPGWITSAGLEEKILAMQTIGATAVLVELGGEVIGAIAVRDELRPEANVVISHLNSDGYKTMMLTGDNWATAKAIGLAAGISEVYADLRPENKADIIREAKKRGITAMIGDGVNDAPALATADIGIAIGAIGTDVAIETADVALMGENLNHLPEVLDHARRTRVIMLQNLVLSLALIGILIPLSLFGFVGLATVVLVHNLAEILVILNGVRSGRIFTHREIKLPSFSLELNRS